MPNLFAVGPDAPVASIFNVPPPPPDNQIDSTFYENQKAFAKLRPQWAKTPESPYRSEGIRGFLEVAATRLGLTDRTVFGQIEKIQFVKNIIQSLSTLSTHNDDLTKQEVSARLLLMRLAITVTLEGVTDAMQDCAQKLGLELPIFSVTPALPFLVTEPVPLSVEPAPSCQPPTDDPEEPTDEHAGQLRNPITGNVGGVVRDVPAERPTGAPGSPDSSKRGDRKSHNRGNR